VLTKFQIIDVKKFQWFEVKSKKSWRIASYNSWFLIRLFWYMSNIWVIYKLMTSSSTSFRRILINNIEKLVFNSTDDEVRDSCDSRDCRCDDKTRNEVFNDWKKKCFDYDQDEKKIWFANSAIFRPRWSYDSRILLIISIEQTQKQISDSSISTKRIESRRFNCTNVWTEREIAIRQSQWRNNLFERFNYKELIKEKLHIRRSQLKNDLIWKI
jgi:hypothetical protein